MTKEDLIKAIHRDEILRLEFVSNFQRTAVIDALWPHIEKAIKDEKRKSYENGWDIGYKTGTREGLVAGRIAGLDKAIEIMESVTGCNEAPAIIELLKEAKHAD